MTTYRERDPLQARADELMAEWHAEDARLCLKHNADSRCASTCGIGCREGECDCECTDLECPASS